MSLFLKIFDVILKCGTEYSGFNSVDLQKWSLKLPAGKYKIKGEVNLLSNAAKEIKWGIDHMSKIPQMFPNLTFLSHGDIHSLFYFDNTFNYGNGLS